MLMSIFEKNSQVKRSKMLFNQGIQPRVGNDRFNALVLAPIDHWRQKLTHARWH